jgi:hypothetical protein
MSWLAASTTCTRMVPGASVRAIAAEVGQHAGEFGNA